MFSRNVWTNKLEIHVLEKIAMEKKWWHTCSQDKHIPACMWQVSVSFQMFLFACSLYIYRWKKNKPPLLSIPPTSTPPIAEHTIFGSYFTTPSTKMYIANYFKLWKLCEFYWIYLVHKLFKHIVLLVTWIQLKIACTDCMHTVCTVHGLKSNIRTKKETIWYLWKCFLSWNSKWR